VLLYNLTHQNERKPGMSFFDVGRARFGEEAGDGPPAVLKIMVVFSMVSVFWALFDQHASTWIDQAKRMDLMLSVPAYLGYWTAAATLVLSIYGGVWLFRWIANALLPRNLTVAIVAVTVVSGLVAAACDLGAPPIGDPVMVDGQEVRRSNLSIEIGAAQFSAVNPLFVMIIIPGLNVLLYGPLRSRGIEVSALRRMTIGMFLAALAFVAAAVLQQAIQSAAAGSVHVLWQTVQYFIMTVAEVLVSTTGLEFAYTQAPRAMKSTIMGFWLFCVTMGNLLVAFLAPLQKTLALSEFFWLFAALMAGAATIFLVLAMLYRGKTYLQEAQGG
jgi:dipeptide/tripeptide permease